MGPGLTKVNATVLDDPVSLANAKAFSLEILPDTGANVTVVAVEVHVT